VDQPGYGVLLVAIFEEDFLRLLAIFLVGGQGVLSLGWDSAFLKAAISIGAVSSEAYWPLDGKSVY
jgi:hypothetical protein